MYYNNMSVTRLNVINSDNTTLNINNISNENIQLGQGGGTTVIGASTPLNVSSSGVLTINNLTDSSSITTGSINTLGGFGISKSLYTGTSVNLATVSGITTIGSSTALTITADGILNVNNTTESINSSTASTLFQGGISIAKSTDAVSVTQGGAATIVGGLSVGKKVFVGGNVSFADGLNMNNTLITNVANPVSDTDVTNKGYVDSVAQGLDIKESVVATTTGPGTLASSFENGDIIDGITLTTGDRILIKDQVSGIENGIYIVQATGAPLRSSDFTVASSQSGAFTFVQSGTINADSGWVVTNDPPNDVVGTDSINFTQFSGAGQIIAGAGLSKSVNTLSVNASLGHVTSLGTLTSLTVSPGIISGVSLNLSDLTADRPVFTNGSKTFISASITGTGTTVVLQNSPTLITPVLGAASGTSLNLTGTTASTSTTTGTLIVPGGIGFGGKMYSGGGITIDGDNTALVVDAVNNGRLGIVKQAGDGPFFAVGSGYYYDWRVADETTIENVSTTSYNSIAFLTELGKFSLSQENKIGDSFVGVDSGTLNVGGDIVLYNATSNTIGFRDAGSGAPIFSTRSLGTKLLLREALSGSSSDYAIGIESNSIWSSLPQNTSTFHNYWYAGTTIIMDLRGNGILNLPGTTASTSSTTGIITTAGGISSSNTTDAVSSTNGGSGTLAGGLAVAKKLFVGTDTNLATNSGITTIGSSTALTVSAAGLLTVNNTATSTSTTTGALIVSGGAGIAGALFASSGTFTTLTAPHSGLSGLLNDDHTQYSLLAGRSGGQILTGGNGSSNNLVLRSTTDATKGQIFIDETTASTSTTTGALRVAGGFGLVGKMYSGGGITIDGDNTALIVDALNNGRLGIVKKAGAGPYFAIGSGHIYDWRIADNSSIEDVASRTYTSMATLNASGVFNVSGTAASTSNTTGIITTTGGISSSNTTDAVSSTNGGSGTLAGGLAVAKKLFVGTDTNLATNSGITTIGSTTALTVSAAGVLTINNTTNSTSTTTGALIVSGGVGITGDLFSESATFNFLNAPHSGLGGLSNDDHPQYTLLDGRTGGQIIYGGISGDDLILRSSSSTPKGQIIIDETTASTSTTTGALTVAGGLGVQGTVYANSANFVTLTAPHSGLSGLLNDDHTQYSLLAGRSGGQILTGGTASSNNLVLRSTSNVTKGQIYIDETTVSTSTTTGALRVGGGLGVEGTVYANSANFVTLTAPHSGLSGLLNDDHTQYSLLAGRSGGQTLTGGNGSSNNLVLRSTTDATKGQIYIDETTVSTSTTTGALRVGGGFGLAGKMYSGGGITIDGDNTALIVDALSNGRLGIVKKAGVGPYFAIGSGHIYEWRIADNSSIEDVSARTYTSMATLNALGVFNVSGTTASTSSTTGIITTAGGISSSNTTDAVSSTNGGSGTLAGGLAVAKKLFVGTDTNLAVVSGITTIGSSTALTVSASGVLNVNNTTDSTSTTTGSAIITGGLGVAKSLFVGPNNKNLTPNADDITSQVSFTGVESASGANVTGLAFSTSNTRSFKIQMSVVIVATTSLYAQFELTGIYNGTTWFFNSSYLGDNTLVTFNISAAGQVTYSSSTYTGFTSLTMKFRATTIAV